MVATDLSSTKASFETPRRAQKFMETPTAPLRQPRIADIDDFPSDLKIPELRSSSSQSGTMTSLGPKAPMLPAILFQESSSAQSPQTTLRPRITRRSNLYRHVLPVRRKVFSKRALSARPNSRRAMYVLPNGLTCLVREPSSSLKARSCQW